ncbi:5576_t:CDS:2, partial [Gigaspora margarita]
STVPQLLIIDDTYTKPPPGVDQNLTIFIGIMTIYEKIKIRECLRKLYTHNNDALARYLGVKKSPVTIRFIMGLAKDEFKDKLEEESKMYGDIVILNITESMEKRLNILIGLLSMKDNYLVKMDDDAFIHLIHYYRDLQDLPRKRAYYDIVGSNWVNSNVKGYEDKLVGKWICHVAKKKKYFVHYVGYSKWIPTRQNPIHDFNENLDLNFLSEIIMIHQVKGIKKCNAIKDTYSKYKEGLPMVKVIRNSTEKNLVTKREVIPKCWKKKQIWNQTLQNTYKNWFYEAWGFKEGKWYGYYGPVDNIGSSG